MFRGHDGGKQNKSDDSVKTSASAMHQCSPEDWDDTEQDEPSSSQESGSVDELSNFREQWQKELNSTPEEAPQQQCLRKADIEDHKFSAENTEEKAQSLFLKGVQHEQDGKLYEAVKFYRQAVQLVPDVETRLYEATKAKTQQPIEVNLESLCLEETLTHSSTADEDVEGEEDMLAHLQRLYTKDQTICQPDLSPNGNHLSCLPMEIILYIMKWVVSSELDLRILDQSCSAVCRGFYLAARDPEIWRLACVRIWGVNCGGLSNFDSWRQMFIERPHIHFHGCYISKTTYLRPGENSFQDQLYRPWHVVEYFRYLRFFPEGIVLMLTTADEPPACLRELKHRRPRDSTVLRGHYRLYDDHVTIVLKRETEKGNTSIIKGRSQKRRDAALWNEPSEQTFHLELQIASYRSHRHVQLLWQGYSVITHRGGTDSTTNFDLISGRFPPFHFSRVKSYTAESENIMQ